MSVNNRLFHVAVRFFFPCLFLLLTCEFSLAGAISGKIIRVSDGDTVRLRKTSGSEYEIRLYGIDTPEMEQPFGRKSKKHTSSLVLKKRATVTVYDKDRYGRLVGVVKVGKINVNQELVENGFAWHYDKYCKETFCESWKNLEYQARTRQLGLWRDSDPTPPWEWRKKEKQHGRIFIVLEKIEHFLKQLLRLISAIEQFVDN